MIRYEKNNSIVKMSLFEVEPTDTRFTPADAVMNLFAATRGIDFFSESGFEDDESKQISIDTLAKLPKRSLVLVIRGLVETLVKIGADDEAVLEFYEETAKTLPDWD